MVAAIEDGSLDPDRLDRYRKLSREDARNTEAIWEGRARGRRFEKMVRSLPKKGGWWERQ